MAEHESFLNEEEQRALAAGDGDLLRTDVILSVRQFVEELGLSEDLSSEIFERVEQRLDDMSEKKVRKAAKAFGKVAGSFTVAVASEEESTHAEPQVIFEAMDEPVEVEEQLVDLTTLTHDELAVEAEANDEPVAVEAATEPSEEVLEPALPPYERIARQWSDDEEELAALSEHFNPAIELDAEGDEARQSAIATLRQRVADVNALEKVTEFTPQELINLRTLLGWFRTVDGDEKFVSATPLSTMLKSKSYSASKRKEVAEVVQNGLQKLTDAVL